MPINIHQTNTCQQHNSATKKSRTGWDSIKRDFWSQDLSTSAKVVLGYLTSNSKDFNPSLRAMAKILKLSINTIVLAIKKLEIKGYLKLFKRRGMLTLYKILKSPKEHFLYTTVSEKGVPVYDTHRNSTTKEKHTIICDVDNNKYDPKSKVNGLKSSLNKLSMKLAKRFHGSKGYDFVAANTYYSDLIKEHGKMGYDALKAYSSTCTKSQKFNYSWKKYISEAIVQEIAC